LKIFKISCALFFGRQPHVFAGSKPILPPASENLPLLVPFSIPNLLFSSSTAEFFSSKMAEEVYDGAIGIDLGMLPPSTPLRAIPG
jgi:hypothetical protein